MHATWFKIGIGLIVSVVLGGTAMAAEGDKSVVVQPGDSLSKIAVAQGLPNWLVIWNANPAITRPDVIYPGQTLVIPASPAPDRPLPAGVAVANSPMVVARAVSANYAAGAGGILQRIRMRESGGNYAINTGNGYYGAYQFDLATWRSVGGIGLPSTATPSEQDLRAQILYDRRGCQPWPRTCY